MRSTTVELDRDSRHIDRLSIRVSQQIRATLGKFGTRGSYASGGAEEFSHQFEAEGLDGKWREIVTNSQFGASAMGETGKTWVDDSLQGTWLTAKLAERFAPKF